MTEKVKDISNEKTGPHICNEHASGREATSACPLTVEAELRGKTPATAPDIAPHLANNMKCQYYIRFHVYLFIVVAVCVSGVRVAHTCHGTLAEVKGQLYRVNSPFPPFKK